MARVQTFDLSPVAGERWAKLPLIPLHKAAWTETKATTIWAVPAYADIWLAMMCDRDHEMAWFTDQIDTAATDDKFLYINPTWYFKQSLDQRLFTNCHEIAEAMYGHAGLYWNLCNQGYIPYNDGVSLPVEHELLNAAGDYIINDQLIAAKIGTPPERVLHWPELITGEMHVIDAYRLLWESQKTNPNNPKQCKRTSRGGEQQGPGTGESFDQVLKPGQGQGKTPNKAISERSKPEWDAAVQSAMDSAKRAGQLPANLERLFTKRLQPQADWRDLFMQAVSRKIGNDRYTWDRLDQQLAYRNIGCPGRTSFGCELVVMVIDTSGSINQPTFDVFMAEATALLEQAKPKRLIFVQCDTDIQEWLELDATTDLYECKLIQGGGTSFHAPFKRIEEEGLEPDLVVYLTDLEGDQNEIRQPPYPVIWGCITDKIATWGETVRVPKQSDSGE